MEGEESNQQVTNSNEKLVIAPENNGEAAEAVGRKRRRHDETALEGEDVGKACNFPIHTIEIGKWQNTIKMHNEEMTFRCYFKKARFAWEALIETTKMKVEYRWEIIQAIELTEKPNGGKLEILLKSTHTPLFFREKDLKPRKHSDWESCEDFTKLDPEAWREGVHDLHFEAKHFNNLRKKILAAADTLECLRNLIDAPLLPEASSGVQKQVALPNGKHNGKSTCEPQVQKQIAHEPQVQRQIAFPNGQPYNHTKESYLRSVNLSGVKWTPTDLDRQAYVQPQLPKELGFELPNYSNPQLQHHPLPPYPPSCSQVYYDDKISPPISGVSFPTQRVLGQGNVINNCFPRIMSNDGLNQLQLIHQQHSLSFNGSPSSPPPQAPAIINPNQYGCLSNPWRDHQASPKADVDMQLARYRKYKQRSLYANGHNNSTSPPTDAGRAELVTTDADQNQGMLLLESESEFNQFLSEIAYFIADIDNSTSPPTDGSACLYVNIDNSTSPPTDGSGAELDPNGPHQSHQINQGAVMMDGTKNEGGDGDLYSMINYPMIQKSL